MITQQILTEMVAELPNGEEFRNRVSYDKFVQEFRTLALGLPRQTGKTTLAKSYVKGKSALVVVPYEPLVSQYNIRNVMSVANFANAPYWRGKQFNGLRYQCLVLDEVTHPSHLDAIMEVVVQMKQCDMLTDDFHIVGLFTPRFGYSK